MKKCHFIIFVVLSVCVLFLSSCREGIVEPVRLLELYVVDTLGMPVSDATVDFYFSERGLNTNTNKVLESFYTDEKGIIKIALDVDIFDYYVNVEKGELNNWYTNTFVSLPNLFEKNIVNIQIKETFKSKLTGKYKKRWQQTHDIINGNASLPNCSNQLYHDFIRRAETEKDRRDGEIQKYQTSICSLPGSLEGINQWNYDEQTNTVTFGQGNFAEIYKVTEFTEEKMSLVYTTPDGAFVIERKYKVID